MRMRRPKTMIGYCLKKLKRTKLSYCFEKSWKRPNLRIESLKMRSKNCSGKKMSWQNWMRLTMRIGNLMSLLMKSFGMKKS
jgi:hypothetical protein